MSVLKSVLPFWFRLGKSRAPDDDPGSPIIDAKAEEWIGEKAQEPDVMERNIARVQNGFWAKLKRVARRIPFAHDLLAAYFCAMDPKTPVRVRATLFGALAYFVLPLDSIPDFLLAIGFTDDAAVLLAALSIVAAHITPSHRQQAQDTLTETLELVPEPAGDPDQTSP